MNVLITGAAGFIGQRLINELIALERLNGKAITRLTLLSRSHMPKPKISTSIDIEMLIGDIADIEVISRCLSGKPQIIFHLAAVVSSAAEANLDLGMKVNFDATRLLLESCAERCLNDTRLVMTSSIAAYGGTLPNTVEEMTALVPQNSYGTQKAMSELLINDYSRRGLVDACVLRLPTIIVRPGQPNAAATSFASSIFREPLNGKEAVCPVPIELEMFVMSPQRVIDALIKATGVPANVLGLSRCFTLPGITVSVGEMLQTLEQVAGVEALDRVTHRLDTDITDMVASFPSRFDVQKAKHLGFESDKDLLEIIISYQQDMDANEE